MYEMKLVLESGSVPGDVDGPFTNGALTVMPNDVFVLGSDDRCDVKLRRSFPDEGGIIAILSAVGGGLKLRIWSPRARVLLNGYPVTDFAPIFADDQLIFNDNVVLRLCLDYPIGPSSIAASRDVRCVDCEKPGTMPLIAPLEHAGWLCSACIHARRSRRPRRLDGAGPSYSSIHNYDLLGEIGSGGFGTVFEAIDRASAVYHKGRRAGNVHAAIKVFNYSDKASNEVIRFIAREQLTHLRLSHKCLVRCYNIGSYENYLFIAMEHVPGGALSAGAASIRSFDEIIAIAVDLFEALAYLHASGFVHRDVKPQNTLLTKPDASGVRRAKVGDFGFIKGATVEFDVTATRECFGTPSFIAPEVMGPRGFSHFAESSDIYSAAATIYFALTGAAPVPFPSGEPNFEDATSAPRVLVSAQPVRPALKADRRFAAVAYLLDQLVSLDPTNRRATTAEALAAWFRSL